MPTKAFWVAIAMVVAVRLVLGAMNEETKYFRAKTRHSSFLFIEDDVIRKLEKSPRILLMGSSRMRYGLHELDFAEFAGLPESEVANIGVVTGSPQDALWQIQRNPELLERTELVILDLYRHMLRHGDLPARTFRYATSGERWTRRDLSQRVELVMDSVFRHRADRRQLTSWISGLTGNASRDDIFSDFQNRGLWEDGEYRHRIQIDLAPEVAAQEYMLEFEVSADARDAMVRFLDELEGREVSVVLVHTPSSSVYRGTFADTPGAVEGDRLYWEWVDQLAARVPVLIYQGSEDIGVTEADFLDYAHLERPAARVLTLKVVTELRRRRLIEGS